MDLILELLKVEKDALAKTKPGKNPSAKDTPPTKNPPQKKEPTKKQADAAAEKEAKFKVAGQDGKLVPPTTAPMQKFCKGDKVRISTGADENYAAHIGKCGTVEDHGYCKRSRDTFYNVKLAGTKKAVQVYERDLAAE